MNNEKHETFCNYNLTNLLIKSGFDWQDYFVVHDIDEHFHWEIPLYIAQRWLREEKRIIVNSDARDVDYIKYNATIHAIYEERNPELHIEDVGTIHFVPYGLIYKGITGFYDTYEEALEEGIKQALEIILEKKNKNL